MLPRGSQLQSICVDPVGSGLVQSLARPAGNLTGRGDFTEPMEIAGEWLELLLQIDPLVRIFGYLHNPDAGHGLGQFNTSAAELGLVVVPAEARAMADIDGAFEKVVANGAEVLVQSGGGSVPAPLHVRHPRPRHHLVNCQSTVSPRRRASS